MNRKHSFTEAKAALIAMAAEADELQQAVGGSITEVIADGSRRNTRWQCESNSPG